MLYNHPLVMRKNIQVILLAVVYLVTILLGAKGAYVCISEQEHAQIEFFKTGCKAQPTEIHLDELVLTQPDCGDCSDYALTGLHLASQHGAGRILQHKNVAVVETIMANALVPAYDVLDKRFAGGQNHLFASFRSTILII